VLQLKRRDSERRETKLLQGSNRCSWLPYKPSKCNSKIKTLMDHSFIRRNESLSKDQLRRRSEWRSQCQRKSKWWWWCNRILSFSSRWCKLSNSRWKKSNKKKRIRTLKMKEWTYSSIMAQMQSTPLRRTRIKKKCKTKERVKKWLISSWPQTKSTIFNSFKQVETTLMNRSWSSNSNLWCKTWPLNS
jgi:hypothetical protein